MSNSEARDLQADAMDSRSARDKESTDRSLPAKAASSPVATDHPSNDSRINPEAFALSEIRTGFPAARDSKAALGVPSHNEASTVKSDACRKAAGSVV